MRWLVYTLATIAAAAGLTLMASKDRGYVLINFWGYSIESSLVTWIVVLIITFILAQGVIRLLSRIWRALPNMRQWRSIRRKERATAALINGLLKLSEGDWLAAEKTLVRFAGNSRLPLLNYLYAARAAHEQNEFDRRDNYLKLASQNSGDSETAVKLTLAQFQLDEQKQEQALATLQVLQQMNPRHRSVIRILAVVYRDMHQWNEFLSLVPQLRKQRIFIEDDLSQWEREAYIELLKQGESLHQNLENLWYRIPQSVQARHSVLTCYIQQLLKHGKSDVSETLIRNAVKKQWNEDLVHLYGVIDGADARAQLNHAENWLNDRPDNPVLLLTLGRLSLRNQLWGKARSYLEASIGADGPAESYNELAQLLEKLGELDQAMEYYREGLRKTPQCQNAIASRIKLSDMENKDPDKPPAAAYAR